MLICLRDHVHPDPAAPPTVCRLELRAESGRIQVHSGEPATADLSLRTTPKTLSALLTDPAALDGLLYGR
ncbi:hypothetical protein [Nonomuraea sp. NPDC003214]